MPTKKSSFPSTLIWNESELITKKNSQKKKCSFFATLPTTLKKHPYSIVIVLLFPVGASDHQVNTSYRYLSSPATFDARKALFYKTCRESASFRNSRTTCLTNCRRIKFLAFQDSYTACPFDQYPIYTSPVVSTLCRLIALSQPLACYPNRQE